MNDPGQRPDAEGSRSGKTWLFWGLVGLLVVGPVYGRALLESRSSFLEGRRLQDSDPEAAVVAYRHAVEWYAPANPYSARAAEALYAMGSAPVASESDQARALLALESLRSGILVARSLYTPYGDRLEAVEQRIAALRGAEAAARTGRPLVEEVERHLGLLEGSRERAPGAGWSLVTTVAFVLWLGLTWRGIDTAFGPDGRLRRRRALGFALASGLTLGIWILGLTLV